MIINRAMRFFQKGQSITSDTITRVISLKKDVKLDPNSSLLFQVDGTGEFSVRFEMGDDEGNWYAVNELDPFTTSATQSLSSEIAVLYYVRAKVDIGPGGGSVTLIKVCGRG